MTSLFLPLWLFSGKGEKLFPDIDVAIPVNDTRDCWHQENGISSFVCHRAHKSRRQNTLGQVRSWTFEMSKLYEKVSHLTFPDNSVATSNCPQTCWSNLSQWCYGIQRQRFTFLRLYLAKSIVRWIIIHQKHNRWYFYRARLLLYQTPSINNACCLMWSNLG